MLIMLPPLTISAASNRTSSPEESDRVPWPPVKTVVDRVLAHRNGNGQIICARYGISPKWWQLKIGLSEVKTTGRYWWKTSAIGTHSDLGI